MTQRNTESQVPGPAQAQAPAQAPVHTQARERAFDLLRLAHDSLSASLRFDYFSNGKGHKQSKAVLAPGAARRKSGQSALAQPPSRPGAEGDEAQATPAARAAALIDGLDARDDAEHTDEHADEGADDADAPPAAAASWEVALADSHALATPEVSGAGDITDRYLAEVSERHRLTSSEEYRLARRTVDGDEDACRQLVEHHLGLVVMMARRYVNRGLPLLDLIEEGNLGLLTAVRKFDPELGYRLSTYAKWWIREGIEMALMTQSRVVRVPVHLSRSAKQAARRASAARGRSAAGDAVAQAAADNALSADLIALLDDDDRDGSALLQELEAGEEGQPEALLSGQQRQLQVRAALDALSAKERTVIEGRFGLKRDETRTLEAIGKELGLTYERVRQIEKTALVKLRAGFASCGVTWDALL
jgi:RNA polymerase nonessential primary-like sigma factor